MKSWKLPSHHPDVAKYVECFWFLEKEQGDDSYHHPKLNPDPTAHLIIADKHQPYEYDADGFSFKGTGNHCIYPHRKTFTLNHEHPFKILGVKFKVGALYALQQNHFMSALDVVEAMNVGRILGMSIFDSDEALAVAEQDPQAACSMLEECLLPWLYSCEQDIHSELVERILPLLSSTPIAQLGSVLNRSQRTIERSFNRVTNLTLKQCLSMMRLESMLNDLYELKDAEINWGDFAAKYDFSDQPHLIRYLKTAIGQTPAEYARQRDLTIDTYGDFDWS